MFRISSRLGFAATLLCCQREPAPRQEGAPSIALVQRGASLEQAHEAPPLNLQVLVYVDDEVRRVETGGRVAPGARLGFRVRAPKGGHLLIAGIDDRKNAYLCFPKDDTEASRYLEPDRQQPFEDGRGTFGWLDEEIVLDTTPGHERLVALLCPNVVSYAQVARSLLTAASEQADTLPQLFPDCSQDEVLLLKSAEPSSSR